MLLIPQIMCSRHQRTLILEKAPSGGRPSSETDPFWLGKNRFSEFIGWAIHMYFDPYRGVPDHTVLVLAAFAMLLAGECLEKRCPSLGNHRLCTANPNPNLYILAIP